MVVVGSAVWGGPDVQFRGSKKDFFLPDWYGKGRMHAAISAHMVRLSEASWGFERTRFPMCGGWQVAQIPKNDERPEATRRSPSDKKDLFEGMVLGHEEMLM